MVKYSARNLIAFVKSKPFVYNAMFIAAQIFLFFGLTEFQYYLLNTILYCSPLVVALGLIESRLANLCKYHKIAVLCPITGYLATLINDYFYNFGEYTSYVIIFIVIFVVLTSILCGYKVFIANEKREKQKSI